MVKRAPLLQSAKSYYYTGRMYSKSRQNDFSNFVDTQQTDSVPSDLLFQNKQYKRTSNLELYPGSMIENSRSGALVVRNNIFTASMQMPPLHTRRSNSYNQERTHTTDIRSPISSALSTTFISPPLQPSRMALEIHTFADPGEPRRPRSDNMYMGDPSARKVYGLEDALNCSLFVTNIPRGAKPWEVFDRIHVGAVASLCLRPENEKVSKQFISPVNFLLWSNRPF